MVARFVSGEVGIIALAIGVMWTSMCLLRLMVQIRLG